MSWNVSGKVCLITGANTGIGRVTAVELARQGATVVLAGRSEERTLPVIEAIRGAGGNAEFLPLDLGSFASVRACADAFLASGRPLHLLIANAGLAGFRGLTEDGFEVHFGTNHLGHFLLTCLLRERLVASSPARVVVVASRAHYRASGIDFDAVRRETASVTGFAEYGVSKLANVLFAAELGRRLAGTGVTTYSLHPGVVASDVWRRVPWPFRSLMKLGMITNEEGAQTTLHCATAASLATETGLYYDRSAPKRPSRVARDEALQQNLWERSEAFCGCSWST
jgi:retinol dehydrogenase-12